MAPDIEPGEPTGLRIAKPGTLFAVLLLLCAVLIAAGLFWRAV